LLVLTLFTQFDQDREHDHEHDQHDVVGQRYRVAMMLLPVM